MNSRQKSVKIPKKRNKVNGFSITCSFLGFVSPQKEGKVLVIHQMCQKNLKKLKIMQFIINFEKSILWIYDYLTIARLQPTPTYVEA